jgi:WD40 repeat protein
MQCIVRAILSVSSNDGGSIVTGGSAGKLCLWRLNEEPSTAVSLEKICSCKGHSSSITSLTFSLDDKQVVSVGDDGAIFVWTAYIS